MRDIALSTHAWGWWSAIASITVVAALYRLVGLPQQTPFHDEWHVLVAVSRFDFFELATRFGQADHSIPVALFFELTTHLGGLRETTFWLPFAIGGLLAVLGVAYWARAVTGPGPALILLAFLACSPLMIFYARVARPYGLAAPTCLLLVFCLASWCREARWRVGAAAVLFTGVLGWALPVYLPFCAGAWAAAGVLVIRKRDTGVSREFGLLIGATGALLLVLLGPALGDLGTLGSKSGTGVIDLRNLVAGAGMVFGAHPEWLLVPWLVLIVIGAVRLVRERSDVAALLGVAAGAQLAGVLLAAPDQLSRALVVSRYLLPLGMAAFLCAAVGSRALPASRRQGAIGYPIAAALCLAALSWQPRLEPFSAADNFRSTRIYHRLFFSAAQLEAWFAQPPAIYDELAAYPPGSMPILEIPYNGMLRTPYPYYQQLHRQPVYLGKTHGACGPVDDREIPVSDGGFAFRRFVRIDDLDGMRARGIGYAILHRDVEGEVPWVRPETRRRQRFAFDDCVALLTHMTGTSPQSDGRIAWFRLDPE